MKITHASVLLLAFAAAGTASAAEPAAPAYTEVTVSGVKVGIDPTTGKLRPLTATQSKALDAALLEGAAQSELQQRIALPANEEEALKTRIPLARGGMAMKVPLTEMSTVKATLDSSGAVRVQHDGETPADTREMADE